MPTQEVKLLPKAEAPTREVRTNARSDKRNKETVEPEKTKRLYEIIENKYLPDDNLTFIPIINSNLNLFGAIHRCSIKNIRLENGMIKADIIDTVDYNEGEMTVAVFRYLQETGQLENFYFVIQLEVPLSNFVSSK